MNRKKSKRIASAKNDRHSAPEVAKSAQPASVGSPDPAESPATGPTPTMRRCLSIWLSFHLFAIGVSFTSVVEPSTIQARLSTVIHPYLQAFHFAADDRPVYLAHGDSSEQPHRLQVTTSSLTDIDAVDTISWQTVGPDHNAGLAVSDRVARWLSTAATLAENDQPSLVAELLLPIVEDDSAVTAIRIVRLPTDLNDINAEAASAYVARVIRHGDLVSLVQLNPARLSSRFVSGRVTTPSKEDQGNE